MKYIINLTVTFDPDNRLLILKNDPQQSIELSKPATRLLSELINNNRINLLRDDILKKVWEDYGFSPSNASLNNHISELRKAFSNLAINKDIIFTVPRVGFRLDAEIHPIQNIITQQAPSDNKTTINEGLTVNPGGTTAEIDKPKDRGSLYLSLKKHRMLSFVLALLLLLSTLIGMTTLIHTKKESVKLLTTYGKCSIYDLNDNKPNGDFTAKIIREMTEEGIDCSQEDLDIFYAEAHPNNERLRVRLLAACSKLDTTRYKNCLNYKIVE
ncbi:winged helix-turn-helix domain-containing protein [Serratia silvae]|uniref:Winged helix-turn-helix domain-containing protein n=1 Tax=Serratia silvae TaxID=2824122 RepID=A0ABT0KCD8_9GAMM|nr:winged helix-turn-helix domain-containing protein [Serratia silvae]MCL1029404.1 winged helix-turn-helix domain-containing protein [Serratia silvae]